MSDDRRILVVDDEPGMRLGLSEVLRRGGFEPALAASAEEALEWLRGHEAALMVTDLRLPGRSGLDLLAELRAQGRSLRAIVITAFGTVEDAVQAMKLGALDFLTKPFAPADLLHLARTALAAPAAEGEERPRAEGEGTTRRLRPAGDGRVARPIVSRDPAVLRVLEIAETVASSRAPVLVQGESGTGKELLARYLHDAGARRGKPFVAVNCAALPRELLESELFGHERGAFTGALQRKPGKFELAHGGTILLDEISEMEVPLQAKLLRVLQEYEIDRVGGLAPVPVDVRVVATTNRRLRDLVARGRFREDLFYRLMVVPLVLPPLRERPGDVELLAEHFVRRFAGGRRLELAPEARAALRAHHWPGNVRELEHVVERAVLLARGPAIRAEDLWEADSPAPAVSGESLAGCTVADVERRLILETLQHTGHNRTRAARLLGISIRTLRNKLAEYRQQGLLESPAGTES